MDKNDGIVVEKLSQAVNFSYPERPTSEHCVVFFEEEPQWYRRRKLSSAQECDVFYIYAENSVWAGVEEISKIATIIASSPYSNVASITYGSSVFPMLTFLALSEPDLVGLISPKLHENSYEFLAAARNGVVPTYEKDCLRTYLRSDENIANELVLQVLGAGGGWSREIENEHAEMLRTATKTMKFLKELLVDDMRALDSCFERIVFGEH